MLSILGPWLGLLLAAAPTDDQIHKFIYPAPATPVSIVDPSYGASVVHISTSDGLTLAGIERAPRDGMPVLLVFHGNESSAMESMRWLEPLLREGYGIVAAEYREYAGNPGTASETGLATDADAFFARARQLAKDGKLIVIGHSLGAAVAFGLATRQKFDALVTIGAFTRLADMAPEDQRARLHDKYDNVAAVTTLKEPLYLIHGTADDTVPYRQAEALRAAGTHAGKAGALFTIKDAGHTPASQDVAMILQAIAAKLYNGGKTVKVTLPQTVSLQPF